MANAQQALETSTKDFDKKVCLEVNYLLKLTLMFILFVYSLSHLVQKASKIMSKIADSFHKEKGPNDDLAGTSF